VNARPGPGLALRLLGTVLATGHWRQHAGQWFNMLNASEGGKGDDGS
jgi:hypothetical protein